LNEQLEWQRKVILEEYKEELEGKHAESTIDGPYRDVNLGNPQAIDELKRRWNIDWNELTLQVKKIS
jgi:hypothetical protein